MSEESKARRLSVWALFVLPTLLVLVSLAQYLEHDFDTLMGDDLYNLTSIASGDWSSNPLQMLFGVQFDKWRPVFQTAIGGLFGVFGFDMESWIAFNVLLHTLSALLLYHAVISFAPGRALIAFTAAVLFATTRFADYQLFQVTGLVEGLSTFLMLAAVNFYILAWKGRANFMWVALGFWAAAVLTHERYLAMIPAIWLAAFFWPVEGRRIERIWYVVVSLVVVGIQFGYRAAVGQGGLTGTGGTSIGFDFNRIATFLVSGIANALGFNFGPSYLSGEAMRDTPPLMLAVTGVIFVVTVGAVLFALFTRRRDLIGQPRRIGPLIVLLAAIGGAALVASITIRQEFRWILTVYLFVLIAFALAASSIRDRRVGFACTAILLVASLAQSAYYRQREPNVFFFTEQAEVERLRDLAARTPTTGATYLVVEDPAGQCNWGFGQGRLFKLYEEFGAGQYSCVVGLAALPPAALAPDARILLSRNSDRAALDITSSAKGQLQLQTGETLADLTKAFDLARLSSQAPVDTPSQRGAFVTDGWQTDIGGMPAIVVVSGYNISVPLPQPAAAGSALVFGAGMPYPSAVQARLWVALRDPSGAMKRVWEETMTPPADGVTRLKPVRVPLEGAGASEVVFGIDTPQGDASGHWAIYAAPRVVGAGPAAPAAAQPGGECSAVPSPPNDRAVTWCPAPRPPK